MDLLAEHALGDYRSLLAAVSRNLSMGCMLTFRGSRKEDPRTGRHPDENYAREVMQLFSIGLLQLHPDGTPAWKAARRWKPIRTPTSRAWPGLHRLGPGWPRSRRGIPPPADEARPRAAFDGGKAFPGRRHSGRHGRPAVAGAGHGRDLGPSQRRPLHRRAADSTAGRQQSQPGLRGARGGGLRRRRPGRARQPEGRDARRAARPGGALSRPGLAPLGQGARTHPALLRLGAGLRRALEQRRLGHARHQRQHHPAGAKPDARAQRVQLLPAALHARRHRAGAPGPGRAGIADHRRNQHRRLPELPRHLRR